MGIPAERSGPGAASERFARIREAILASPTVLCPERSHLITEYFRVHDDPPEEDLQEGEEEMAGAPEAGSERLSVFEDFLESISGEEDEEDNDGEEEE